MIAHGNEANNNKKAKGRFWYLLSPSAGATTIPPMCSSSDVPTPWTPDLLTMSTPPRLLAPLHPSSACHILRSF
jgi:hypothetical protein